MKYLVLSDIHGSTINLKKVLEHETYDKILILGDVLPHGPRNDLPLGYNPKEVISILNPLADKIICVKGNCDAYVDQMVLEFPINDLACVDNIYMTHGHIYNPSHPLPLKEGVVLFGHTHVKENTLVGNVRYLNPGSLSIPKDGSSSYMVIMDDDFITKNVEGEVLSIWTR